MASAVSCLSRRRSIAARHRPIGFRILFLLLSASISFWLGTNYRSCEERISFPSRSKRGFDLTATIADIAHTIPPLRSPDGIVLIPSFKMVLSDLYGRCAFVNVTTGREHCSFLEAGHEHTVHSHVFNALLSSLVFVEPQSTMVVDLGSNVGVFSLSAAALGFRVTSIEAQIALNRFARASAAVNGFSRKMLILDGLVIGTNEMSAGSHLPHYLYIPGDGEAVNETSATKVPIGDVVQQDVQFLKIDLDGPEGPLMFGLLPILKKHKVYNIAIEINSDVWHRFSGNVNEEIRLLVSLFGLGYCAHYVPVADQKQRHRPVMEELKPSDGLRLPGYYQVPEDRFMRVLAFNSFETKNFFFSKQVC